MWHGVRHGHAPEMVGWLWPIWELLAFLHAELRRNGVRCYKSSSRPPIDPALIDAAKAQALAELDGWDIAA